MNMRAEILCVGTEILLGDIINTNAAFISKELADIGIDVFYQSVIGDNADRLRDSLKTAFQRADLVIMTGGLGPTYDDLTKEVVAEYFGLELKLNQESMDRLKGFFEKLRRPMTDSNIKQAYIPDGAAVFQNERGTAPGMAVSKDGKTAVLMPGPPHEMERMMVNQVIPYLMQFSNKVLVSHNIKLFGIGESNVEDMLHDMMANAKNPTIAPYAKPSEVTLRVTASGKDQAECEALIAPVVQELEERLGDYIYGVDVSGLPFALVETLKEQKMKIATAESCTGGLVSQMITSIAGSSAVFDCGICSYSNNIKQDVLGITQETLQTYGAVSEQTAAEMAARIREIAAADIGVSITGIAGPDGGTPEKPVGTVYIGVNTAQLQKVVHLDLGGWHASDERQQIRARSAKHALFLALKAITGRLL